MKTRQTDRRTNRTRRSLKEALFNLILEKGYDAVTVEEITDRADLGRTTFYLHYRDKEDLLLESIDAMADDLVVQVSGLPITAWKLQIDINDDGFPPLSPILLVFEHAAENAQLYRVILRGVGASKTSARIRSIIVNALNEFIDREAAQKNLTIKNEIPMDVFANYFAGSLLGLLTWWLENDMPYAPQEMALMFQKMFLPGASRVLGVNGQ